MNKGIAMRLSALGAACLLSFGVVTAQETRVATAPESRAALAQGFAYHGPDSQVGHMMIVHHIEVHDIGAGGENVIDFLAQAGKIGGQDGWGNQVRVHDGSLTTVDNNGHWRVARSAVPAANSQWLLV